MDARIVTVGFDFFIRTRWKDKPELMHFTLIHERRHIAELNVMREVQMCAKNPRMKFDKKKLEMLIAAGASIFCDLAKAAKDKQLMSRAELARLEAKAGEIEQTQAMVDEWEREALSTAVSKAMPSKRLQDGISPQEGSGYESELEGAERVSATADSGGRDSEANRPDPKPV